LQQGVLVRHLILPGKMKESMQVVRWLWENFGNQVYLSLMNQFTPLYQTAEYPEINRRLTTYEYQKVIDYARDLGIEQCFIQQGRTASKEFVPDFNGAGL
jgi:putative pyruvate formate lyase activating enzyme